MQRTDNEAFKIFSAICLIAGTCIGGGMLALPITAGISGFLPSTFIMVICWCAMTASALLLLEVNLWMHAGAHILTMSSAILGPIGKIITWVVYLFICYASIVAYAAAGGVLIGYAFAKWFGITIAKTWGSFLFIFLLGIVITCGNRLVSRVNSTLFIAMIAAYIALIAAGIPEIKNEFLYHQKWSLSYLAIPLFLTSFSFQTMLPSLTPYLKRNSKALCIAIIGGTTLTFIVYLFWQGVILGIIPLTGPHSLIEALESDTAVTQFMQAHVSNQWLAMVGEYFTFFALATSFLGMTLGLFDFLGDSLKIDSHGKGKIILGALIIVPTAFFLAQFERVFVNALDISGGLGDTIINGIIPVLMVWIGRYKLKFPDEFRIWGGKPLLVGLLVFFGGVLILAILIQTGQICSVLQACKAEA